MSHHSKSGAFCVLDTVWKLRDPSDCLDEGIIGSSFLRAVFHIDQVESGEALKEALLEMEAETRTCTSQRQ